MKYIRYFFTFLNFTISFFIVLALATYNFTDSSIIYQSSILHNNTQNILGSFGANLSGILLYFFGCSAWLLAVGFFVLGYINFKKISLKQNVDRVISIFLLILVFASLLNSIKVDFYKDIYPGGVLGISISRILFGILDYNLVNIFLLTLICSLSVIILRFRFIVLLAPLFNRLLLKPLFLIFKILNNNIIRFMKWVKFHFYSLLKYENYQEEDLENIEQILQDVFWEEYLNKEKKMQESSYANLSNSKLDESPDSSDEHFKIRSNHKNKYLLPKLELLNFKESKNINNLSNNNLLRDLSLSNENSKIKVLEEKLSKFGIVGQVTKVIKGPVVTLFEYRPSIDTKISNILARQNDLALAMQTYSLRIIAPIPGKDVIGFEISHNEREVVDFAEICKFTKFQKYKLPLILGKNVIGENMVIDLADQPHLLVAGSTGSGKSVGLNCMINTILFSKTPDQVKFILIDPKRLEFVSYQDIAHLLFPIITETTKAIAALKWAVSTMEKRYELLASCGVKNIEEYYSLPKNKQVENLSYIIIIIDELADLMMIAGKEIEYLIARLAQMARAAGIHMIVATQRPSVDIITGTIKVNFPSRVAFKVTSKIDSRTILDSMGAETLLGKGDMLFLNSSSNITRIHGAYMPNNDIESLVSYIKFQAKPNYIDLCPKSYRPIDPKEDKIYTDIITFIQDKEEISISLIQRVFKVGYNRSATIVDKLEQEGYILPPQGGKMRKVVKEN